ncbi:spore germination protein [Selenomonadales bacterium OttesenSCG-928-I06]|nr:spore germination protein [Selenomonadales bacterium OttesenSCG-928-I06]
MSQNKPTPPRTILFATIFSKLKKVLTYEPANKPKPFILEEKMNEAAETNIEDSQLKPKSLVKKTTLKHLVSQAERTLEYSKDAASYLEVLKKEIIKTKTKEDRKSILKKINYTSSNLKKIKNSITQPLTSFDNSLPAEKRSVSTSLSENKELLRNLYHLPLNTNLILHDFVIKGEIPLKATLVFFDGLINKEIINTSIIEPLTRGKNTLLTENFFPENNAPTQAALSILPSHITKKIDSINDVLSAINIGDSVLFIENSSEAIIVETKGSEHRSIERAQVEQSIRGSQAAFVELLDVNIGMMRNRMPTNDLISETLPIGDRIPTTCSIMYLKSLANEQIVAEVRRRLQGVRTDFVADLGMVEQFIEDQKTIFMPKTLQTERPDRVASYLAEGRIALFLNGSPFAMIIPVSFFTFFQFIEDYSMKLPTATFTRILRLSGMFIATLLPGIYISLVYFHQETLPTNLLIAIVNARQNIPFPAIVEILIMEIAFELIREAGLRVPGLLGATISIVGAIIIGQAAVTAKLVSQIIVVLIAITGLASFTIPEYRMATTLSLIRFAFLFFGYFAGFVGIGMGLFLFTMYLCYIKSFGISYMAPLGAKTFLGSDLFIRNPVYNQELRPDFINAKDKRRQPHISRTWEHEEPVNRKK